MKNPLFILIGITLFVSSCSESPQEKMESDKREYMIKAQAFMQDIVDKDEKGDVTAFQVMKIDSIYDLTESSAGKATLKPLYIEYQRQLEYAKKLLEIDKTFDDNVTDMTQNEINKAVALEDSFINKSKQMEKLGGKIVGKSVIYTGQATMSNGTKNKGFQFELNFDLENDLPIEWNKL